MGVDKRRKEELGELVFPCAPSGNYAPFYQFQPLTLIRHPRFVSGGHDSTARENNRCRNACIRVNDGRVRDDSDKSYFEHRSNRKRLKSCRLKSFETFAFTYWKIYRSIFRKKKKKKRKKKKKGKKRFLNGGSTNKFQRNFESKDISLKYFDTRLVTDIDVLFLVTLLLYRLRYSIFQQREL